MPVLARNIRLNAAPEKSQPTTDERSTPATTGDAKECSVDLKTLVGPMKDPCSLMGRAVSKLPDENRIAFEMSADAIRKDLQGISLDTIVPVAAASIATLATRGRVQLSTIHPVTGQLGPAFAEGTRKASLAGPQTPDILVNQTIAFARNFKVNVGEVLGAGSTVTSRVAETRDTLIQLMKTEAPKLAEAIQKLHKSGVEQFWRSVGLGL